MQLQTGHGSGETDVFAAADGELLANELLDEPAAGALGPQFGSVNKDEEAAGGISAGAIDSWGFASSVEEKTKTPMRLKSEDHEGAHFPPAQCSYRPWLSFSVPDVFALMRRSAGKCEGDRTSENSCIVVLP